MFSKKKRKEQEYLEIVLCSKFSELNRELYKKTKSILKKYDCTYFDPIHLLELKKKGLFKGLKPKFIEELKRRLKELSYLLEDNFSFNYLMTSLTTAYILTISMEDREYSKFEVITKLFKFKEVFPWNNPAKKNYSKLYLPLVYLENLDHKDGRINDPKIYDSVKKDFEVIKHKIEDAKLLTEGEFKDIFRNRGTL